MHASQAALRSPAPPTAGAAPAPLLRSRLEALIEALEASPAEGRAALRARVQAAQRGMLDAGVDDGVLALLLRNMLGDLARAPSRFDAAYFAAQLARTAERLG